MGYSSWGLKEPDTTERLNTHTQRQTTFEKMVFSRIEKNCAITSK